MEALVDLLPLLFIGAYYLLAARRRQQQKEARERREQPGVTTEDRPGVRAEERGETPFQSFLSQLEEAMAEAANPGSSVPAPPKAETVELPPAPPAPDLDADSTLEAASSFERGGPNPHERHGFGSENPLSEEAFEQQPAFTETARAVTPVYDPHALRSSGEAPKPTEWQKRLSDPKAAQDAFVLQTVFGARGGRRAESRR